MKQKNDFKQNARVYINASLFNSSQVQLYAGHSDSDKKNQPQSRSSLSTRKIRLLVIIFKRDPA